MVQLAHVFEKHEHTICVSKNDHHFHESDIDCDQLHYQFKFFSQRLAQDFEVIVPAFFKATFSLKSQIASVYHNSKKLSRAPPNSFY
ncbi:hypothetical protein P8625_03185 [Tenacibaculum tangerinum]|uniref:Uncharacterized protein n=1 Tax=Tenacibaculum tangerinum TaxID=3038772 RepID=A0ABY8L527_9FLAO|nr:hypothetical protein [Tenacibaculum tangerinum]WGH76186.1 hypothetical protein P8625_03185 [Tenacibaculum tangerinum]